MPQLKRGFTTMVDLDEFKHIRWTLLRNVKKRWEYDGIAYLFRQAGLPLYGKPLGSMKENHPYLSIMVPRRRNENYGVNLYVPCERLEEAQRLAADEDRLRCAAERERAAGSQDHEHFYREALAQRAMRQQRRKEARRDFIARLLPHARS